MSWLTRIWNTLRQPRPQREIDREIAFHLAERADDLQASGMSGEDSRRHARVVFGNVAAYAERTRDMDIVLSIDSFIRNVRYALRTFTRAPGFAATVVLTLALGMGANTAVFSIVNAVLLRPLPFPHGDRLMRVSQTQERTAETHIAPIRLEDWNRLNSTFEAITGYFVEDASETSGDFPEPLRRAWVAPRFLDVWGIAPALGRGFSDQEHVAGGPAAVVISDRYWRRRFAADQGAIGKTVRIAHTSFTIVGVMPATFRFPDRAVDLWFPVALSDTLARVRQATWYAGIGRLKPDVTAEQARANLAAVQAQLAQRYPDTDRGIGVNVLSLKDETIGGERASLWLTYGAVSVLLLISCMNVAALLLSRAAQRQQEIAIRLALGASRATVMGQMVTETALLAAVAASAGLAIAAGAIGAFRSAAADLARSDEVALDGRILIYTMLVTVAVAIVCGLFPAIRARREHLAGAVRDGAPTQVSTRNTVQWLLVGTQVALSVALLATAALLARSLQQLSNTDPGFASAHVLTFRISGSWSETADYDRLIQRIDQTIDELNSVPGVIAAATSVFPPGVPAQHESTLDLVEARDDSGHRLVAESRFVSPEYFATMRIPWVEGEPCTRARGATPSEGVVNRSFATRYLAQWPSAIGLHLSTGNTGTPPVRIVGVVGDARERGLDREAGPIVYACSSAPTPTPYFLVRTRGEPSSVAQDIRVKIKNLEPLRAVYDMAALEDRIGDAFTQHRFRTLILAYFAIAALVLAAVGLYGTLSYTVTVRRREIGLRLALGAARGDIVRQFLRGTLRLVSLACACGLALSLGVGRVLAGMLYGVSPSNPIILAGVLALVMSVCILAALIPAVRAARSAPLPILRGE
jgi:putative ABC transport system permease protein